MKLFENLSKKVRHFRAALQFRDAIQKAEEAHVKTGKRFYVMGDESGKLIVLDRKNFRMLRMKHYIDKDEKMYDALNSCFYFTAQGDGNGFMSENIRKQKECRFFAWTETIHAKKKKK